MAKPSRLMLAKSDILSLFSDAPQAVYSKTQLADVLLHNRRSWHLAAHTTASDFISFLIKHAHLRARKFRSKAYGQEITRYSWAEASPYELALSLKPRAYLCHDRSQIWPVFTTKLWRCKCGPDGPEAWTVATEWNARWQAFRRGEKNAPIDFSSLTREEAEIVRRYPSGSVGSVFQRYIRTEEWTKKAYSNRTKVWWPCWYRIRDMWSDIAPDSITFEQISAWRAELERLFGLDVAHKTIKIWRALWNVMVAMKVAHTDDPSLAVTNSAPRPRHQRWSEGEAVRLVKGAWRKGYRGLACCIAVAWDTQFSPVDVRTLAARHRAVGDGWLFFDRQADGRAKTGRAAIGTVSRRTERLVATYLRVLGTELLPDAILFRTRSGDPYREDTLADDFAAVREIVFPTDKRRLMDMRRSGTVEAIAGGATGVGLAAKMANSINTSNALHRTYAPVEIEVVREVDDARQRGRRKMRARNEQGAFVSTQQPASVSTGRKGDT